MKDDVPTLRWKAFERQRTGWYATGTRMAANQFVAEKKEVVGTVRAGADPAKVIKAQRKAWGIMYLKLYLGIGADFAPRAIGELKSASPDVVKAADDVWMRIVSDYVRRYSGARSGASRTPHSASSGRLLPTASRRARGRTSWPDGLPAPTMLSPGTGQKEWHVQK